jgi:N-acetyl-anhydromuramyl-L-alanine amidase AmpD
MKILSPYLTGDERTRPITTVILHWTAGASPMSSIEHLRKVKFSYHYIIGRNEGEQTYKCLPTSLAGRHTGFDVVRPSRGPDGAKTCNQSSIGISFALRGTGNETLPTAYQIEQAEEIIYLLKSAIPSLRWLTRHFDCAPLSRPTELRTFPLDQFAERVGLLAWKRK